jgi:hypothetical protein
MCPREEVICIAESPVLATETLEQHRRKEQEMSRTTKWWTPMALGAVLMLILVGVAGAVPTEKPSALGIQRKLTITAADFYPKDHLTEYNNDGFYLYTLQDSNDRVFIAPVDFPTPRPVTVDKVQLHAYDNNSSGRITIRLYRPAPATGIEAEMAYIDTGVAFVDPAGTPRTWQTTSISPNVKYQGHDTYLWAAISDDTSLWLYGVTIYYRVGT